jgi:hypothetical protein
MFKLDEPAEHAETKNVPVCLLAQFRTTATPEEFSALASGYRSEIERMQKEVLEYLTRHAGSGCRRRPTPDCCLPTTDD